MHAVSSYFFDLIGRMWWQIFQLFAVPISLAILLQLVGSKIRRCGALAIGSIYWYVVAPGVVSHETGHAVGCLLTGTEIVEFVPFCRRDGGLGYVLHKFRGGLFGGIANFIIATGPIWFGSFMIVLLTKVFAQAMIFGSFTEYFGSDSAPAFWIYLVRLFYATGVFLIGLFSAEVWGVGFVVWLYLAFCIASEIGLSTVDLFHMKDGALRILIVLFIVNLIPCVGQGLSVLIYVAMPYLFKVNIMMLFVLMVNLSLLLLVKSVASIVRRLAVGSPLV